MSLYVAGDGIADHGLDTFRRTASRITDVPEYKFWPSAGGVARGCAGAGGGRSCALAGAVGNAASYGITAAQTGKFSRSGLAKSAAGSADTAAQDPATEQTAGGRKWRK
jgi:hypothetical protein